MSIAGCRRKIRVQVGDFHKDHNTWYKAELDNKENAYRNKGGPPGYNPRPVYCVDDVHAPGADLLFLVAAAFAASAIALRGERSHAAEYFRKKCESKAVDIYYRAFHSRKKENGWKPYHENVPGVDGYPNVISHTELRRAGLEEPDSTLNSIDQYAYWAAAWMYKLTHSESFLHVRSFEPNLKVW